MSLTAWLAILVFASAYVVIVTERFNRAAVALLGAAAMVAIGSVRGHDIFFSEDTGIDWNVIFLLFGMMVIVGVLRQTGVFEFVAIWSAQRARARPFRMMVLLVLITAVASASVGQRDHGAAHRPGDPAAVRSPRPAIPSRSCWRR